MEGEKKFNKFFKSATIGKICHNWDFIILQIKLLKYDYNQEAPKRDFYTILLYILRNKIIYTLKFHLCLIILPNTKHGPKYENYSDQMKCKHIKKF